MRYLKIAVALLAVSTAALAASTIRLGVSLNDERTKTGQLTELTDSQLALMDPMAEIVCLSVARGNLAEFMGEWVLELTQWGLNHDQGDGPDFKQYTIGPEYLARLNAYETYLREVEAC